MAILGGSRSESGYWRAVIPVRLTGSRSGPDAFVLGAALRAAVAAPYRVGVAVNWFGPRSWRVEVTPARSEMPALAALDSDGADDDYRAASVLFVDFDEDEHSRRIATVATEPMPEPFARPRPPEPLDVGTEFDLTPDELIALDLAGVTLEPAPVRVGSPADYEVTDPVERADLVERAGAGAAVAVEIGRAFAVSLGAVAGPTPRAEDAATAAGLSGPSPWPDPTWLAGSSHVATLRTLLRSDEIAVALRDVPFERLDAPGSAGPAVFVLGDSGHAADQVVTATLAGDHAPGTTVLVSYLIGGSGDEYTDAVVATRAKACVETVCEAVLRRDRFAVRDDHGDGDGDGGGVR